jgi:anaerobic dimethyl sulfoxide reductase subunit C
MSEWPLIVFTLAIQCAAGLAVATTLLVRVSAQYGQSIRPLGIAIFPLAAAGLLASLFHLGRPSAAWKSLLNLGHSRLSLEVLITVLFVGSALLYSHAWWVERSQHRATIGAVTSILAIVAVASSASIYMIPTQPAWDSGWVPVSFLGTMLVFGGTIAAGCCRNEESGTLLDYCFACATAGGVALFAAGIWMYVSLTRSLSDPVAAARLHEARNLLITQYPAWFWLYLALAGIVPVLSWALVLLLRTTASWLPVLCAGAALAGSIIGRTLMYILGTKPSTF